MNLRKFPVIAPDGTEYRVEILEAYDSLFGKFADVSIYTRAKWRKFKHLYTKTLRQMHGNYDPAEPDYVRMVSEAFAAYSEYVRGRALAEEVAKSVAARKQAAIDRFNAWDGRIKTEVSENETA